MTSILPQDADRARLLGRVWRADLGCPSVVAVRGGRVFDITHHAPTMAHALAHPDPLALWRAEGEDLGPVEDLLAEGEAARPGSDVSCILAPADVQPVRGNGVTYVRSLLERVIEERAKGDPAKAAELRRELERALGGRLSSIRPGSPEAMRAKEVLVREGLWSQYLEVGIGPDAEVFAKAPPMSAVGPGAFVGIRPDSKWNNPEPEVVLAVAPDGRILGATLGNDVNLRDFEGRSALLLGKAKDNNGSCAIGPFVRLFDDAFDMDALLETEIELEVVGEDGFRLNERHRVGEISRPPQELVRQLMEYHPYPDGVVLFLGTLFAPVQDREGPGSGFTHHVGDVVRIRASTLGLLENRVGTCDRIPPWDYGIARLMHDLARRGVLRG